jgi:hypothetical protein
VEQVFAGSFLDELPARLLGDKAYDSDQLDEKLAEEYGRTDRAESTTAWQDPGRSPAASLPPTLESGSSLGCTTSAGWSHDGSTTLRTSSGWFTSAASSSCCAISETGSKDV